MKKAFLVQKPYKKQTVGWIWPTGHSLPTTELEQSKRTNAKVFEDTAITETEITESVLLF